MKLWKKDKDALTAVTQFTTGSDNETDLYLARFDVLGSLAHIIMLETIGLLTRKELDALSRELKLLLKSIDQGNFRIEDGVEDIHSQIEWTLTQKLGDVGKKIHSGRSRNDQVLVDIKLFLRNELKTVVTHVEMLFNLLLSKSEEHKEVLMPGYTHLQLAMPSSFGLWFGAYAESLVDDLITVRAAYQITNKNPLGSGAGYGSSFPLNRTLTTHLLGFEDLNYNVVYAQMGRGKTERMVTAALGNIAATLAKLSMDACLFLNQNFAFIQFPEELTTGSSIMPHKKNPDVFELVRAKCNTLQALPFEIQLVTANLPSGYHRDLQVLKEKVFPAFQTLNDCLRMIHLMLSNIHVNHDILKDEKYQYLFSVEEVNKRVLKGIPFRDAYKEVGQQIEKGDFRPTREVNHTHEGSIGNLSNDRIRSMMKETVDSFPFATVDRALTNLAQ